MAQPELDAVDHFTHALAESLACELVPHGIDARTVRMDAVVDEVVARLSPTPGISEVQKALNLKLADGLVSLLSAHIDVQASIVEQRRRDGDPTLIEASIEAHDHTVRQYYRLIALRSELAPECRPSGEVLKNAADIDDWAERSLAQAHPKT
jgi:hypothetical protein